MALTERWLATMMLWGLLVPTAGCSRDPVRAGLTPGPMLTVLPPVQAPPVHDDGLMTVETALHRLAERCPLPRDAVVQAVPLKASVVWGQTWSRDGVLNIRIDSGACVAKQVDVLIHEWAHAMVWDYLFNLGEASSHGDVWGLAYSRAYRAVYQRGGGPPWDASGL